MKREKYIFATLLIPFFLFSLNLKLSRLESDDKTASFLIRQETQYLSKSKQSVQKEASLKQRLPLVRKTHREAGESPPPKILRRIRPENLSLFRSERKQDGDSSFNRENFILINEGHPYRFNGEPYAPGQVLSNLSLRFLMK